MAPGPFRDAVSFVRKDGQIFALGLCVEPVDVDLITVLLGDICIEGSLAGSAEFSAATESVAQRRVDVESLVSHAIVLDEVVTRGFDVLDGPRSGL